MRRTVACLLCLLGCPADPGDTQETDSEGLASAAPARSCEVTLTHTPEGSVDTLQVAGTFSDWEPLDMSDDDGDGTWELWLGELQPGAYGHKFVSDGTWEEDVPADVYTTWDDGYENRLLRVDDCDLPTLAAVSGTASPDGSLTASFQITLASTASPIDPDSLSVTVGEDPVFATLDDSGLLTVSISGLAPGKHSVRVDFTDLDGNHPDHTGFLPLWVEDEPFVWQSGLLYFVFLDRFASAESPDLTAPDEPWTAIDGTEEGTDYLGGDLVGALELVESGYFDDLGVRTLWLSPVADNPEEGFVGADGTTYYSGYHGYWPIKAREVENRLGTTDITGDEALEALIDAAHARGMRVVLDLVLNHVHEDHEYVTEHPDWFTADACVCTTDAGSCNWDTNPIGCWFTDYLPDLDYQDQDIVDQVLEDVHWWTDTYDVDGFRIDAAKHMNHVILRSLSMQITERYQEPGGADFYLVGETFTGAGGQDLIMDYVADYELDGQFDFTLLYPLRSAVGSEYGWYELTDEVAYGDAAYGDAVHGMSPFLGNHDIPRYATEIVDCEDWGALWGVCWDPLMNDASDSISDESWEVINKMAVSFAFVSTQPGVPLLYYGDEIGLAGGADPDNRRPMVFDDLTLAQQTLLERFQELGKARATWPSLWTGERTELWVDDDLYVYGRDPGDGEVMIVAMNIGSETRTESVPITVTSLSTSTTAMTNVLAGGQSFSVDGGRVALELDPYEYVVLAPE